MRIHRFWHGDDAPTWTGQVILRMHPDARVTDWTLEEALEAGLRLPDGFHERVVEHDRSRHLANLVRWWALARFGGLWLDHDLVPLTPLDQVLGPGARWTAAVHGGVRVSCAVHLPEREDGLALAMLQHMREEYRGAASTAPRVSGDHVLNRLCPDDVGRLTLPLDRAGRRTGGYPWAVHTWETSAG